MKNIDTKEVLFDRCPHCGGPATYELCGKIEGGEAAEKYGTSWIRIGCERCGTRMDVWAADAETTRESILIAEGRAKWNRRDGFPKRPSVYISGAITNDPNYAAKFAKVEEKLREMGFDPINPAKTDLGEGASYKDYIDHGMAQLMQADLACRISPAPGSDGVKTEMTYAAAVGIPIFTARLTDEGEVKLG